VNQFNLVNKVQATAFHCYAA